MTDDRGDILQTLQQHHSSQGYRPEEHFPNVVSDNGKYLGPYIPYVGKDYFEATPRILIYAMAQNLARSTKSVTRWLNKDDKGLLRQYYQPEKHGVSISPYETGHLRVIAALASSVFGGTNYTPQVSIHDRIAVTNFVKFSFYRLGKSGQHMDANPPTEIYDDMWRLYGERETCILEPDIVIAVGDDVYSTLRQNMAGSAKLLKIPFPGRLNLNSRWVPLGKRLIIEQNHNPVEDISELDALMKGTPDPKGKIRQAIRTDWYYFTSMKEVFVQSF